MNFKDYISNNNTNQHENELHEAEARPFRTPEISLETLQIAMSVHDKLVGNSVSITPLAMRARPTVVYFIWYDNNEKRYYINSFSPKTGISRPLEDGYEFMSEANKSMKSMKYV